MSKDLEKEYRALMDSEAPDLWARIESGLQEKKPVRQKKTAVLRWVGLAAACACVALCIPVLKIRLPLDGSTFDAAAPNLASDMVVLECAPEEKLSLCYYASSAYQRQKGLLRVEQTRQCLRRVTSQQ